MIRKLSYCVLVGICAALLAPLTFAADDSRSADREAIDELMWKYARALDTFNADAYIALFTEDGEFKAGAMSYKGRDALKKMINDTVTGREQRAKEAGVAAATMYHMTTDSWTEFVDDTHALHHVYFLTATAPVERGKAPSVVAVGRGVDHLVKVNGEWLIKLRDVAPTDE